jgi:hypothetical protein
MSPSDAVLAEFTSAVPLGDLVVVFGEELLLPPPQPAIRRAAAAAMEPMKESRLIRYLLSMSEGLPEKTRPDARNFD